MVAKTRIFRAILIQIQITFTAGITLYPATDLTVRNFTLICDLQGTSLANLISFTYNSTNGGRCTSPPNPSCISSIGTITPGNTTVSYTLNPDEVPTKGNSLWTCSHGSQTAQYPAVVITYCSNKKVDYEDKKILLSCDCGSPGPEADVEYQKDDGGILSKVTVNLTSRTASCSPDSRIMDFISEIADFPSETVEACATIKTKNEVADPICNVFDCGFSWAGCISILFIELAAFITIMILLMLKKTGGFSILKVVVSCALLAVALIVGLILGFVLTKCKENNLSIGLGIGLGCLLAGAHLVTIYVIHKKCDKDPRNDDDERKGTPTSTSNIEVKETPTSTSNVEVETR